MKTLILTSLVMIAAIGGMWSYAREHADSSGYVYELDADEGTYGAAVEEGDVLIRVNGRAITQADFELALSSFPENQRAVMFSPAGRKVVAEELIRLELLAQKAEREGLESNEEVRQQIRMAKRQSELVRKNILAQYAIREMMNREDGAGSLRELYGRMTDELESAETRQIIIGWKGSLRGREDIERSKQQALQLANEAVARLRAGESFESVHQQYGDNPESGDLGTLRRDSVPPELAEPIFSLDDGEVSDPIESAWGFQVFQVVSRDVPSFEEVESQLRSQAKQLWARIAVDELRERADVEMDEGFFGKPD